MKIVVMWEDPDERAGAEGLARLLPRIGPSLAGARFNDDGSVSVRASRGPITIRARACPADEELRGAISDRLQDMGVTPEAIAVYGEAAAKREAERLYTYSAVVKDGLLTNGWSPCLRCGYAKYEGAQCGRCNATREQALEDLRTLERPKAVKPEPRKPPSETRDLIFPDEDE